MRRVLILTASLGDGHNAAARNLCDALETLSNEAKVEVFDLFQSDYGSLRSMVHKAFNGLVRFAPALWGSLYSLLDKPASPYFKLGRVRRTLGNLLQETQPDVVVATYPLYAALIRDLYRDHAERPFRLGSVITESLAADPAWLRAPSDIYFVANEGVEADLRLRLGGEANIKLCGFPVSPAFSQLQGAEPPEPDENGPHRILYLAAAGKKQLGKTLKRLLERKENYLTILAGRDAYLKARLTGKLKSYGHRVQVFGWTNQMPQLMLTHHILIGSASVVTVQEAIAARLPLIANRLLAGPEGSNCRLLIDNNIGTVATKPRLVAEAVRNAFRRDARLWRTWRENLAKMSRPDAALNIAQALLEECDKGDKGVTLSIAPPSPAACTALAPHSFSLGAQRRALLCDFHIHTNYSDGKLSVAEVVDFYGRRRFDCICITDHLADSRRLIGMLGKLVRFTLSPNQLEEYFEVIDRERRRAWRKYNMLVMTGLEFNKDGLTKKSSAHLLGLDLHMPILDCLDLPETIDQIHSQAGLAVASHPHIMKSEWGKNTLYLWENQERFAPLIDAWEIANRNNMFNPVSAKRLPYLANSDFHKPKHIYSWKTLVNCEKDPESIKQCIRKNEHIAITLFREPESTIQVVTTSCAAEAAEQVEPCARLEAPTRVLPAA
jgi:processive 1,2-diacylglycerol beta-glucosyltransferase